MNPSPELRRWIDDAERETKRVRDIAKSDPVNHPTHYRWLPGDIEVIDITENLNFCLGNAIKYILRADHKGKPIEDLEKAAWYIKREIERRNREAV